MLVPYTYKWATDAIVGDNTAPNIIPIVLLTPVMLIIAFGVGRILMVAFNQLRDALFVKVGQTAVRSLGKKSFHHLHSLSLSFHLNRRTGALNRITDRGVKGIESIIRLLILNTFPTVIEFVFVGFILLYEFDSRFDSRFFNSNYIYLFYYLLFKFKKNISKANELQMKTTQSL